MSSTHRFSVIATALVFSVSLARGQGPDPSVLVGKIADWPAPATWSPDSVSGGVSTMDAVTSPLPFIGITPCRIVDTRPSQGFTGAYGPPILVANATRDFDLNSAPQCPSVPASAQAYSLNITVTETAGPGDVRIWPTGTAPLNVSTQNWAAANVTIANAAIVPAGTNGSVTVQVAGSNTHLIIDINGYYGASGVGEGNTFLGVNAGNFTMAGFGGNTGIGASALSLNTTGYFNTATGYYALGNNTIGGANTANGFDALDSNTIGGGNTASGYAALGGNTTGNSNTASGWGALIFNTTGSDNTAVGVAAGLNLTTGDNNIDIANQGVAGESGTIRIGTAGTQTATFIAGIYNADATGGSAVFVTPSGKLGTSMIVSSRRFKEDIRDIGDVSEGLMNLRPVAFRYKPQIDPAGLAQYGLIAEEVADVYPDLVVYDRDGQPETVRYHLVNALLLNEVQKQHRTVEAQEKANEAQQRTIEELRVRLSRLEARLLADSRP